MKAKKPTEKTTRKRYSDEFKDQALKRAERDGVALVAQDLGIAETQIEVDPNPWTESPDP